MHLLVWFTISYTFYIYSFLCFHGRKSTLVIHCITYFLYYSVHIPWISLWALADLLGSIGVMGFGFWSGAWEAETVGVSLLWPTLGSWTSLFCITSSLLLSFSSFCSPLGTNLGIFPSLFSLSLLVILLSSLFTHGTFTMLGLLTLPCIPGTFGTSFGFTCNLITFWSFTVGNLLSLRWIQFLLTMPDFVCIIYDLGVSALDTIVPSYHVLVYGSCTQTGCLGMRSIISLAWASWWLNLCMACSDALMASLLGGGQCSQAVLCTVSCFVTAHLVMGFCYQLGWFSAEAVLGMGQTHLGCTW